MERYERTATLTFTWLPSTKRWLLHWGVAGGEPERALEWEYAVTAAPLDELTRREILGRARAALEEQLPFA